MQLAAPVPSAAPGDQVFSSTALPLGIDGALRDVWVALDSGTVGADGIARTASPPFPGLSDRGQVLVAEAAEPVSVLRVNFNAVEPFLFAYAPAMGIAAVSGLSGLVTIGGLTTLLAEWVGCRWLENGQTSRPGGKYAANEMTKVSLTVDIPKNSEFVQTIVTAPPRPPDPTATRR